MSKKDEWFLVNARAFIERRNNQYIEILVQTRNKPGERNCIELPGGRLEPFESLLAGLKREVKEETGLDIVEIEGEELKVDTVGINLDFEVECVAPFAAYQTINGPIDSMGVYFRCRAEGTLLDTGDGSKDIRWMEVEQLSSLIDKDPLLFSNVDRAGIMFYMKKLQSKTKALHE